MLPDRVSNPGPLTYAKLCLTPEIKSKYFRTGECVGIGQTTVLVLLGECMKALERKNADILTNIN